MSEAPDHQEILAPAIEFRDVSIAFEEKVVLDRVSFKVPSGELRIILGLAGSGKSTILRLAIGLLKPDEGQIFLNGQEITSLSESELIELRKEIGVVFQEDALFTSVPVLENVGYRLLEQGEDLERVEEQVRKVLRLVDLEHAIYMMPSELSGGMSRRTAVARALVGTPKLILYDSPCSGLDPVTEKKILRLVMQLRDLNGTTSLYVTQNMDEVHYLCSGVYERTSEGRVHFRKEKDEFCLTNTKILLLSEGKIIFDAPDESFWNAEQEAIREFLV
jgi:phospholipid/cholesterol/gamma-HCH transport system ATP-binding protein